MRRYLIAKRAALMAGSAIALASAPAAAQPPSVTVTCGQTLTHSVRLANDLSGCSGNGLIIGADDITLDLNGHTIAGDSSPGNCDFPGDENLHFGVLIADGHDGATIANGAIRQFDVGVRGDGASGAHVHDLTLTHTRFDALDLFGFQGPADGDVVEHNRLADSECGAGVAIVKTRRARVQGNTISDSPLGVILCCGDHNVIAANTVTRIEHDAVIVCCGDSHNAIRANTVTDNHESGIDLCCDGDPPKHDVVVDNVVARNPHQGILLEGASANAIHANRVFADGDGISLVGDGNTVSGNDVYDTTGCPDQDGCGGGIEVDGGSANVVSGNRVARTLLDGIRVASFAPDTPPNVNSIVRDNDVSGARRDGIAVQAEGDGTVSGLLLDANTTAHSGDDGIDVRTASATLSNNLATNNGDLGIAAVAGVTDGGGNRAFNNGNPVQCTNVFCAGA
jgi:parallel beta-helix repeat protein